MSATSSTPDPATGQPVKPTIVLVHGAWADSSSWARVIKRLRASGYPVHAIATPLQGLVSGGLSTIAGLGFLASSGMDDAHLAGVGGYMALGAVLYLLWAHRSQTAPQAAR